MITFKEILKESSDKEKYIDVEADTPGALRVEDLFLDVDCEEGDGDNEEEN